MPSWDDSARQYDAFEKKWHHYEKVAEGLLKQLEIRDNSNILELASGTGACTKLLARISVKGKISGIDSSAEMVRVAKENINDFGFTNVFFLVGDVSDLASFFAPGQFDIAVCNSAFWQFPDPARTLGDVHSLVKIGGKLGFNLPRWFRSDEARNLFRKKVYEILVSRGFPPPEKGSLRNQTADYQELLKAAGFADIEDRLYEFQIPSEMSREWREIPVFSDLFRTSALPQTVTDEIRKEYEKVQNNSENTRISSWKILTARNA